MLLPLASARGGCAVAAVVASSKRRRVRLYVSIIATATAAAAAIRKLTARAEHLRQSRSSSPYPPPFTPPRSPTTCAFLVPSTNHTTTVTRPPKARQRVLHWRPHSAHHRHAWKRRPHPPGINLLRVRGDTPPCPSRRHALHMSLSCLEMVGSSGCSRGVAAIHTGAISGSSHSGGRHVHLAESHVRGYIGRLREIRGVKRR